MVAMTSRPLLACLITVGTLIASSSILPSEACASTISDEPQMAAAQPLVTRRVLPLAKEWFRRIQAANIDRSQLNDTVNLQLTPELVLHEQAALVPYGKPVSFRFVGSGPVPGATGYNFIVICANGALLESIALDGEGKIAGLNFQRYTGA